MNAHCALPLPVDASRTAATVAAELHDARDPADNSQLRDLEPHEQALITAYHRITKTFSRTVGEAIASWGDGSRAYIATRDLAARQRDQHLRIALERYDAAVNAREMADA